MSQPNNYPSKWPKAFVAIFGTASICAATYLLKENNIMWAMVPLVWMIGDF